MWCLQTVCRKGREVPRCQCRTFATYRTSMIMCNVRLCKCAFCFAARCRSLTVSAPEGICGCAGIGFRTLLRCLITPLALKQTEILQPFVSVYPLTVAPGSWSDVSSSITMPEWTSRDALFHPRRQQALSDEMADSSTMSGPFLKVFHHGAATFLPFSLSAVEKGWF